MTAMTGPRVNDSRDTRLRWAMLGDTPEEPEKAVNRALRVSDIVSICLLVVES